MPSFVHPDSVVRRIWGDADTILVVFAGSAAEFALNRAVDWLFFTGEIPRDPLGRLFSTARFARDIAFADEEEARRTLDRIRTTHAAVERQRGARIPDWAHRDVLYMLIAYSERAYALLHRPLTAPEREELYDVFRRVGEGLRVPELPGNYGEWRADRERHLERDLAYTAHTATLYAAYRRQLGPWRYGLLLRVQAMLAPQRVRRLLRLRRMPWEREVVGGAYRAAVRAGLRPLVRRMLVPAQYAEEVRGLDQAAA
jgi:uncharacterized protein (DUF2236 family)